MVKINARVRAAVAAILAGGMVVAMAGLSKEKCVLSCVSMACR